MFKEKDQEIMKYVFEPSSVAVIGASNNEEKERNTGWTGRLLKFGYKGKVYPINPSADEILGLKSYASVLKVRDPIDYAIISIPRTMVPDALRDCVEKGVRAVHIYTAGFNETGGAAGVALQKEILGIIRGKSTRVIGPNCMGVYFPSKALTFDTRFPKESGSIAFFSQTGVGGRRFINLAAGRGLRFRVAVSYGNGIDLSIADFFEYAYNDPETGMIFIYLEGLTEGQRFSQLLKACNKLKPVVILKAGLSESGAGAVSSHTASLCGSKRVWEALFKQTGAISVVSLEEAVDVLVSLQRIPFISGRKIGLVGRGGGIGVISADMCENEGLKVPQLTAGTRVKLERIAASAAGSSIRNPVEIGLGVSGVSEHYLEGLEIVASDPAVDFIITFINPEDYIHYGIRGWMDDLRRTFRDAKKKISKPFCVVILQGPSIDIFKLTLELQQKCQKESIACFASMGSAIKAVSKIVAYHEYLRTSI
jgi:acyl-CoA synthetase (NDP forming)